MRTRRVLIVDDSVLIRRALVAALSDDPGLEVVGAAASGRLALMKIPLLQPDVVALDLEMTEMSGLDTLQAIRRAHPHMSVIILSHPTPEGAAATIDALTQGADDHVSKPGGAVPSDAALRRLADELRSKISPFGPLASDAHASPDRGPRLPAPIRVRTPGSPSTNRVDAVAIGVSTGGPSALMDLLPRLPADFPVPILIVQHMPPVFTKQLAERLTAHASIAVAEGRHAEVLAPGQAWIAPGDFHMIVQRASEGVRLATHRQPPENSCRPAADVLFRSVAEVYGSHALAVVMTGMGQDGLRGCEEIHAAGGQVIVQDEPSSVVWGMPGLVARAGMADQILPLRELGNEIVARVGRHRPMGVTR